MLSIPLFAQSTLTVAAAADLQPALREIASAYEKGSGTTLRLVFGSSGAITTQIQHGAPYDVFLSADRDYPQRLVRENLADADTMTTYAVGHLVLWRLKTSRLDFQVLGTKALATAEVNSIAIANPAHAPYGKAAVTALSRLNLYEAVQTKLVLGENVAQAAQFVVSGNAQVGIIPLSLARAPELARIGEAWELPADSYSPIQQSAVVLKSSKQTKAAKAFVVFMQSAEARDILLRYGFDLPEAKP